MAEESKNKLQRLQEQARSLMDDVAVAAQEQVRVGRFRAFLHFWILVGRSFVRNRCPVRASALSYSSLLAMIPMLALVLSVTTSVLKTQGEKPIRDFVDRLVSTVMPAAVEASGDPADEKAAKLQAEVARTRDDAVKKINEFINKTQTGAIGGTSAIVLLFVAITMLSRIEATFNDIWGVARGRSWYVQLVLYWAAITLGPIILISALGLTTAGQLQFKEGSALHSLVNLSMLSPGVKTLVVNLVTTLVPLVVLGITFAMVYLLLPNTRVQFSAALVGGLTAGVLWQLNNELSTKFVSRVTSNAAIYGSVAVVPVFMIGMYLCWLILLFGAQVAYAFQNRQAYLQDRLAEGVNQRGRELAAIRLMLHLAGRFHRGERPATAADLARECGLPGRLVGQLLALLSRGRLVFEVYDREPRYAPARPLGRISVDDILEVARVGNGTDLALAGGAERRVAEQGAGRVREAERGAALPLTLEHLVEEVRRAGGGPGA